VHTYDLKECLPKKSLFCLPPFVARKWHPGHTNPAMGFFWGVWSWLDSGLLKKESGKSSFDGRARYRNRSGVVELVGRELLWVVAPITYSRREAPTSIAKGAKGNNKHAFFRRVGSGGTNGLTCICNNLSRTKTSDSLDPSPNVTCLN